MYPMKYVPYSPWAGRANGMLSRRMSCSPWSSVIVASVLCDLCPLVASGSSTLSALRRPMMASCCSVVIVCHAASGCVYFCTTT